MIKGAMIARHQKAFFLSRGIIILLMLGIIAATTSYIWTHLGSKKLKETRSFLGTIIDIRVCLDNKELSAGQLALRQAWQRFEEIETRMSAFSEHSDLAKIANAYPDPVTIHADTYKVLEHSMKYFQLSNGAFDVTVKTLVDLWRRAEGEDRIPSNQEIDMAQQATGMHKVQLLDNFQVRLSRPGIRLDLGGIAKGYAVDEAARILREHGFYNFLINAGGDLFVSGRHCAGRDWQIGIRNPESSRQDPKLLYSLTLKDAAITTSGDYEKYYVIQGQKWSHIIDPKSGYPANHVSSATVIASTAIQADALSTALCVMGAQRAKAWAESLEKDFSAYIFEKKQNGQFLEYRIGHR